MTATPKASFSESEHERMRGDGYINRKQTVNNQQAGAKQEKVHTRRSDRVEAGTPKSLSWLEESGEARKVMKVYSEEGRKAKKVTFSQICMWEYVCV